jgi:hypothetical protein
MRRVVTNGISEQHVRAGTTQGKNATPFGWSINCRWISPSLLRPSFSKSRRAAQKADREAADEKQSENRQSLLERHGSPSCVQSVRIFNPDEPGRQSLLRVFRYSRRWWPRRPHRPPHNTSRADCRRWLEGIHSVTGGGEYRARGARLPSRATCVPSTTSASCTTTAKACRRIMRQRCRGTSRRQAASQTRRRCHRYGRCSRPSPYSQPPHVVLWLVQGRRVQPRTAPPGLLESSFGLRV